MGLFALLGLFCGVLGLFLVSLVELHDYFDSFAKVFADVVVAVPDVVAAVGCCLCVVVPEAPFAVVDDSGWFVFGFAFEDFADEAFHCGSFVMMIFTVSHG